MRNGIAVVGLTCFGLSFWLGTLSAYASDDLILPPDLRGSTPAASSTYPSSPKLAPKHAKAPLPKTSPKREAPVTAAQSEPAAPSLKVQKQNSGDDPLSFGMKWNADQTASGPGSLSDELNKNINGATIGTGAEVGVKYKF